jgi:hypothetical protein
MIIEFWKLRLSDDDFCLSFQDFAILYRAREKVRKSRVTAADFAKLEEIKKEIKREEDHIAAYGNMIGQREDRCLR